MYSCDKLREIDSGNSGKNICFFILYWELNIRIIVLVKGKRLRVRWIFDFIFLIKWIKYI